MTSLVTYLTNAVSAVLGTASQLYSIAGTPSTTQVDTTIGTGAGYVELTKAGGAYTPVVSLPLPSGKGWMLDPSTLDDQELLAGNWSSIQRLQAVQSGTPAGTLTSDIIVRASKYSSGTYTTIVTITLTAQTINSTATAYSLPSTAGILMGFDPGEKLYIDIFTNVTVNGNANVNQGIRLTKLSTDTSGLTGDANASITSPGFSALDTTTTAGALPMAASDLKTQYSRIMANVAAPQIRLLATTYYGNATNNQIIYGELDALLQYELISQLHAMKSINDVTAFLQSINYVANVLNDTPIVYYRLGEGVGASQAFDVSGRKMTATINGTVTAGQTGALAQSSDTAYLFDGSTGYIALPAGVKTDNWAGITVEAWVKLTSGTFANARRIAANDNPASTNKGFDFSIGANGVNGTFTIGNGPANASATFSQTFTAGTWYHVVGTWDGTTIKVYVNGVLNGSSGSLSGLIGITTNPINIGRNPATASNFWPGSLDEPTIYNSALSAGRILAHYNAGINP